MDIQIIVTIITAIVGGINAIILAMIALKKFPLEAKKLEAEEDSEIVDAAHTNLEGAKISSSMLIERIEDLKSQLETERQQRKSDADYFRRRIRELERESRDYRLWAAKLARQVIEAGRQPAIFESSIVDSDPLITAINTRDETKK